MKRHVRRYPMPFYPYLNYFLFGALLLIFIVLIADINTRLSAVLCPVWFIGIYLVYKLFVREK